MVNPYQTQNLFLIVGKTGEQSLTTALSETLSMIPLLKASERERIAKLCQLREDCECMLVVNPFVPATRPALSPVIDAGILIGEMMDISRKALTVNGGGMAALLVEQLTQVLFTLGIRNVSRAGILSEAQEGNQLIDILAKVVGISSDELARMTVHYLAEALADKVPLRLGHGLMGSKRFTMDIYLFFFAQANVDIVQGLQTQMAPRQYAMPEEVICLSSPGTGEWVYYQGSCSDRFDPEEDLPYQWIPDGEHVLDVILNQLQVLGAVNADWLGAHPAYVRDQRLIHERRQQNICRLDRKDLSGQVACEVTGRPIKKES